MKAVLRGALAALLSFLLAAGSAGACCTDFGCYDNFEHDFCVLEFHGRYLGDGSICGVDTCPAPGGCCLSNNLCISSQGPEA